MGTKLITEPAVKAVSIDDVKSFLRITSTSENAIIDGFIEAATQFVERHTNRKLINQTWDYFLNQFPGTRRGQPWWDGVRQGHKQTVLGQADFVELPFGPAQSITLVNTFDQDNNETTFSSSDYSLDDTNAPPRIILNDGSTWPTDLRTQHAIKIRAVYGYGAGPSQVPQDLVLAVKIIAAKMYETRGVCSDDELLDGTVKSLIGNHKIYMVTDAQL